MPADDAPPVSVGQPNLIRSTRNSISRSQIETVASRSVALFGLANAIQVIPTALQQSEAVLPVWSLIVNVSIFGGLIAAIIASFTKRWVKAVNGYVALSWFFGTITWPFAVLDPTPGSDRPWLWFLMTAAIAAAAIAWPVWAAIAASIVLPSAYGVVRLTPAGGQAPFGIVTLDVIYSILLGGAVVLIITLLRGAAASVDAAQSTALDRYAHAVRQHATEVERVQVDAIVHDSVLTTFLSAARAQTPAAELLASRMATNAMGYLRGAATSSPDDSSVVGRVEVADRIRVAAAGASMPIDVMSTVEVESDLPMQAAEALYSAAVQAMVNSTQHAGGPSVRRWVEMRDDPGGRFAVEVGDTGTGFDVRTIPTERIGLRVSIVERVSNAGGSATVVSDPLAGTVITLRWPAGAPAGVDDTIGSRAVR
jgi:signal transduction histidine kinase